MSASRRRPTHPAIKTVIYLVIILFGLAMGAWVFLAPAEVGVWWPVQRQDVFFSFAAVLAIRFIDDINHLLGQNVLFNFITGATTGHGWSSVYSSSSI
jgi:hypothetical protein